MKAQQILTPLKKHRQIIPLLLLTAYCLGAIVAAIRGTAQMAGETYDFMLTTKHYLAFVAVIANYLVYFFLRKFYKYSLALIVVIGIFNLITFSALQTTENLSLNSLTLSFQPSAFFAGLLAYFINFKRVNNFIIDDVIARQTQEEMEKHEKAKFVGDILKFKQIYKTYSNESLREILDENKSIAGALEAARQILEERKEDKNAI